MKDIEDSHWSRSLHPHTHGTQCSHTVTDKTRAPRNNVRPENGTDRIAIDGLSVIAEEANDAHKRHDNILHPSKQITNYGWTRWPIGYVAGVRVAIKEQLPPAPALIPAKKCSFPHCIAAAQTHRTNKPMRPNLPRNSTLREAP